MIILSLRDFFVTEAGNKLWAGFSYCLWWTKYKTTDSTVPGGDFWALKEVLGAIAGTLARLGTISWKEEWWIPERTRQASTASHEWWKKPDQEPAGTTWEAWRTEKHEVVSQVAGSRGLWSQSATAHRLLMGRECIRGAWGKTERNSSMKGMQKSPGMMLGLWESNELRPYEYASIPCFASQCPTVRAYRINEVRWGKQPEITSHTCCKTTISGILYVQRELFAKSSSLNNPTCPVGQSHRPQLLPQILTSPILPCAAGRGCCSGPPYFVSCSAALNGIWKCTGNSRLSHRNSNCFLYDNLCHNVYNLIDHNYVQVGKTPQGKWRSSKRWFEHENVFFLNLLCSCSSIISISLSTVTQRNHHLLLVLWNTACPLPTDAGDLN